MAKKKILQKGDPILGKKSHPVTAFDGKLHALLGDMKDTLNHVGGAGLAAVQIGILRRVVLVMDENEDYLELINPELVETSPECEDALEGCLSLSGLFGYVERPVQATVRAQDRNGKWFTHTGSGIVARCFCHELEHLEGVLFDAHTEELFTDEQLDELRAEAKKEKKGRRR